MTTRRKIRAFTLIEILVVVAVVAIVVSVVLLSIGLVGNNRDLDTEARRLTSLVAEAQNEATLEGREFGLEFMNGAYRFVEFDPLTQRWVEITDDDLFRLRRLPDDVEFVLTLEGRKVQLQDQPATIDDPGKDKDKHDMRNPDLTQRYEPHVMIFSSGDATPFQLAIRRVNSDQSIVLQGDVTGAIETTSPES
jgi:general secretion pathway protein H